jgi:hypothetical protein
MFRFNHRISKDIDIFTYDAQALSYTPLTPGSENPWAR